MTTPGFEVRPDVLDEGARKLDGVAGEICGAREVLINDDDLPTLDPLSKAVKIAAACTGVVIAPFAIWLEGTIAEEVAEEIDPYPPVRHAWEDALERFCRRVGDHAQRLRDTAADYRDQEQIVKGRIQHLYPESVPIPTVPPSEPTAPMPEVPPGEPTVPMPEAGAGGSDDPVSV